MKTKLIELGACMNAREWALDKTIDEIWATCHRGDWMLCQYLRVILKVGGGGAVFRGITI